MGWGGMGFGGVGSSTARCASITVFFCLLKHELFSGVTHVVISVVVSFFFVLLRFITRCALLRLRRASSILYSCDLKRAPATVLYCNKKPEGWFVTDEDLACAYRSDVQTTDSVIHKVIYLFE